MNWIYEEGRIYSIDQNNELMAETTYLMMKHGEVDIDHTYVNPMLRGQGVAGNMMQVVAEHLRSKGVKAVASCSYANVWLKKNQTTYGDVVSDNIDMDCMACRVNGKH